MLKKLRTLWIIVKEVRAGLSLRLVDRRVSLISRSAISSDLTQDGVGSCYFDIVN